jgi:hypothetical protein
MKVLKLVKKFTWASEIPMEPEVSPTIKISETLVYNPLSAINTQDFTDANEHGKKAYIKSQCREAEIVIKTLSKMFPGEISNLDIVELDMSVACILKIRDALTATERDHILSVSRHLEFI